MGALAAQSAKPRNILFILSDDHRYDAMGFLKGQKFLETPHLDSLARDGVHCKNAFVTTALCSPSRASILTGKYAHQHKIVDNNTAIPPGSLIDAWVLEHKTGADVLYHLQSHPDELHALLSQPVIDQAETLALLSQRFNGASPRSATVATGSAPALVSPAPRPPNPVRTSPQHASDEPPGDDASLADHERYYPVRQARA